MADIIMPFGKHKGKYLCDIPVEYLDWLIGEEWMKEKKDLLEAIKEHLRNRPEWQRMSISGE